MLEHEQIHVTRGARSGLPVVIAVHSTALGMAIGGCRLWPYPRWQDALDDALRLSEAMTLKCAIAGLDHGGGKTVAALPAGEPVAPDRRLALLHDVGEAIAALGGRYATGPDVGTSPSDMATIAERTKHVFCRPTADGGSGDTAPQTAIGVVACIRATCRHAFGSGELRGRRIGIHGLGQVGANIAHMLAPTGASLLVADIDPTRRSIADALGAAWTGPERLLTAELDVLVPAALGAVLTAELVPRLNCTTIVGPANNQLAGPDVADRLLRRGIAWAPDYVVGAGGALYAITRELHAAGHTEAIAKVTQIGDTLAEILATARQAGVSPDHTARALAERRLRGAAQPFT